MSNSTISLCQPPFLSLDDFPFTGGEQSGRLCTAITSTTYCCLPCPMSTLLYPDDYLSITNAANWVALGSVVCCCIMLLSFLVLPVSKTSRHYLTVCLVTAIGLCCLSFVVALGAEPEQCHDSITPNDMRTDLACAFSGSLVLFGGFASVMWVFLRSLSLFLQICWQIVPGKRYFYCSLLAGWGVPTLFVGVALGLSGVSYRFGNICHINHDHSIGTFWGPLLAFAGLAGFLQFLTLAYCIRVYLRSIFDPGSTSINSSNMVSLRTGSTKTVTARAAYRRVRKVIALQWRGIMVIMVLLVCVIYFAVVFITLDQKTVSALENPESTLPWISCLFMNGGDKNKCLDHASKLILGEPIVMAVLFLIASLGYWSTLFLGRASMITAWWAIIYRPLKRSNDFISVDARRISDPRNYEMLTSPPQKFHMSKGPGGLVATATPISPDSIAHDFSPPPTESTTNWGPRRNPSTNFSHPRPLERAASYNNRGISSREGPAASPIKEYVSSPFAGYGSHASSIYSTDRPVSPPAQQRFSDPEKDGSAARREQPNFASNQDRSTRFPVSRSESQASREWDPRTTYARGGSSRV